MKEYLTYNGNLIKASDGNLLTLHKPEVSFAAPVLDSVAHRVRFFNFDGTLLKTQYVLHGQCATPPVLEDLSVAGYKRPALTFQEWNWNTNNVQHPIDACAIWIPADGKTHLFITLTPASGLEPVLYFRVAGSGVSLTFDWGDGNTNTITSTTLNQNISHTYATYGDYEITIARNTTSFTYNFGNTSTGTEIFSINTHRNILTHAYIGEGVTNIAPRGFYGQRSLEVVSLPTNIIELNTSAIDLSTGLKAIGLPSSVITLGAWAIAGIRDIRLMSLSPNLSTINQGSFNAQYGVQIVIVPSVLMTIPSQAFAAKQTPVKIILLHSSIPALSNTNAFSTEGDPLNTISGIYIADALVASLKSATNWNVFENQIFPMSALEL